MYRVVFHLHAQKDLRGIPAKDQRRIAAVIGRLSINPFVGKKLHGERAGQWSFKIWPHRIIYIIDRKIVTVTIIAIGHRQGVYS